MALDSIAQADADHKELQQLAETLGLKEVDEPLYAADDLQGLVQSSAYEPGDARLSPGVLSPGRLSPPRLSPGWEQVPSGFPYNSPGFPYES